MKNKYVLSRKQNVDFVRKHFDEFINNSLKLSRYEKNDNDYEIALNNFKNGYEYILNGFNVPNDYDCLLKIHDILMENLETEKEHELNNDQVKYLEQLINQPAKANLEIAIDVMLYILSNRMFKDGDVRVALTFANKIMIDNGCGFITIEPSYINTYREKLHSFKNNEPNDLKEWVYKYCIKGIKNDYLN